MSAPIKYTRVELTELLGTVKGRVIVIGRMISVAKRTDTDTCASVREALLEFVNNVPSFNELPLYYAWFRDVWAANLIELTDVPTGTPIEIWTIEDQEAYATTLATYRLHVGE